MPSWVLNVDTYTESHLNVTGSKGLPQLPVTFTWWRKVMWIDYQLHIYFIYIYIFLFSCSLTQLLLRTRTFIPLALIYFCLQCNKNGDRPEITITKKQTQKIEEGERRVRPGRPAAVCCPSLTVAAGRTQSAWCSDIKEEAAEAPSP